MALLQDYNKLFEHTDNIKKIYVNNNVVWPTTVINPKTMPFSIRNMESTSIEFPIDPNYSYSIVDGEWFVPGESGTITLDSGEKMRIRWAKQPRTYVDYTTFPWPSNSIRINIGGNIMSLLDGEYFVEADTVGGSAFHALFAIKRVDLDDLVLPATTLAASCYDEMFQNCKSLTTAPALPATTLAAICYSNMFSGCTSLTTAPALPATTLATYCYSNMFSGCTSLTTAPALPATTLATYCYEYMFNGCTSLTTAPALPATTLANNCYRNMFYFCTSLTTAPALPATTLSSRCYRNMFNSCTSLNTVECLATNISASNATATWLYNVSSTGTFTKASGVTWPSGDSGIPSGWTVIEV